MFACVLIDHLPVKAEVHRAPSLRGRPVVVAKLSGSHRVVLDASPEATNVAAGMGLSEALSACAGATLVEPDPVHYRAVFDAVLSAIEALSADVQEESLGRADVRLKGLELLFGGVDRLAEALLRTVPAHLGARVGVGASRFVASVAAEQAGPGRVRRAPDPAAEFLRPLPVDVLPVPWATIERLKRFGLRTLGQLAALPVGSIQAQFGREGARMWQLATGTDRRPFVPRVSQETVTAAIDFAAPLGTVEAIATAADSLLGQVFATPSMRGRYARACVLSGAVLRAPRWSRRMVFRAPIGSREQAFPLVRTTLEGHPPPGPLEELRLTLSALTGEGGRQESLFLDVRRQQNLEEAVRQLRERLGVQPPLYHVREVEPWSRMPERRQALVPFVP